MSRRSSATSSRRWADSAPAIAAAAVIALCGLHLAADAQPAPARAISKTTDHLSVSATLSALTIAPGGRVTLSVEVKPKAGMHVYAPGSAYRPVAIRLTAGSPFRLEAPVEYPKPALYTFKPLNEQVLVYNAPFRLVAQFGVDPARPAVTPLQRPTPLTLIASLDYQACDDRVCYLPESVPLRWTVTPAPTPRP
jgi:DsbC/DsbD-like thiol-disulfide interchange protein